MKIHRLIGIVLELLSKDIVTVKQLSEMFEVTERTIYRDIESLSQAGIPVYGISGKHGGMKIMEDFSLNKAILNKSEQEAILFALNSINPAMLSEYENLLTKLSSLFSIKNDNWLEIDISSWDSQMNNVFDTLKLAIKSLSIVSFNYYGRSQKMTKRKVEPYRIINKNNDWYLLGYCLDKLAYRVFKINRINSITNTNQNFIRRNDNNNSSDKLQFNNENNVELVLEIDKKLSYRIYDEFNKSQIRTNDNNDYIIHVEYPEDDWLYGYILSFGEHIKVLSPDRIRSIIADKLAKAINNFT